MDEECYELKKQILDKENINIFNKQERFFWEKACELDPKIYDQKTIPESTIQTIFDRMTASPEKHPETPDDEMWDVFVDTTRETWLDVASIVIFALIHGIVGTLAYYMYMPVLQFFYILTGNVIIASILTLACFITLIVIFSIGFVYIERQLMAAEKRRKKQPSPHVSLPL